MFCRNCGSKNKDDAVFCGECGCKLILQPGEVPSPVTDNTMQNQPVDFGKMITDFWKKIVDFVKRIPKKFKVLIGVGIIAIIALAVIYSEISSTINLDKYVEVVCEGYDGYGYAYASIDWQEIEKKYGSKIKYTKTARSEYGKWIMDYSPVQFLEERVPYPYFEKSDQLSNGDEITYTWDIDTKEITRYLDCKIKYSDKKTIKVKSLEQIAKFDPFEDVKVTFGGISPYAYAEFSYTGKELDEEDFDYDEMYELKEGDTVVVALNGDLEYFIEKCGKLPSVSYKEYKVTGLDRYVTNISDIDEDAMDKAKKNSKEIVDEYIEGFSSDIMVDKVTYVGNYLHTYNSNGVCTYSNLGLVYKITSRVQASSDYDAVKVTQFYDVNFGNVVSKADGSCEIAYEDYSTPYEYFEKKAYYGDYSFDYNYYNFYGFETVDELVSTRNYDCDEEDQINWNIEGVKDTSLSSDSEAVKENSEEYICAYSSERRLTRDEIEDYLEDYSSYNFPGNRSVIQMIINEMYARHGYEFSKDELTKYFNKKEWYRNIDDEDRTDDMEGIYRNMSSIEQDNIILLQEYK